MRLKHFLLSPALASLLWSQPSSDLQDCVPATLHYAADVNGYDTHIQDWIDVCHTTSIGTDLERIIPAWNKITMGTSKLVPVYVIPRLGMIGLDARFESFRRIATPQQPITYEGKPYVWVGLHRDLIDSTKYYNHCAIVLFHESYVVLVSPNSEGPNGLSLRVRVTYPDFFKQTFLVLDIQEQELPEPIPRRLTTL